MRDHFTILFLCVFEIFQEEKGEEEEQGDRERERTNRIAMQTVRHWRLAAEVGQGSRS